MKQRISEIIELLRFPLMVGVVFVHCVPVGWLGTALTNVIGQTCVPTFFIISGYLFFSRLEEQWSWAAYKSKMKSRMHTLLIPYIIWNLILALFICRSEIIHLNGQGLWSFFTERGLLSVFLSYWHPDTPLWWGEVCNNAPSEFLGWWQPLNIPLWYVRDLLLLCLCSPIVYFLTSGRKGICSVAALALLLLGTGGWFPLRSITFFSIGAYLKLHPTAPASIYGYRKYILLFTALLFIPALITSHAGSLWASLFVTAFILFMPLSWFILADNLVTGRQMRPIKALNQACFLILVLHFRPTLAYADSLSHLLLSPLPQGVVTENICYLLSPAIAIAVCIAVHQIMHRVMPRTLAFTTGGHA